LALSDGLLLWPDTPLLDTPLARYLLWLDTPWLDTPSTWYLLRASYLLRQHIPSGQLSPQVDYPLRQHISSGTIFVVFPQLQSVQAVSVPLD